MTFTLIYLHDDRTNEITKKKNEKQFALQFENTFGSILYTEFSIIIFGEIRFALREIGKNFPFFLLISTRDRPTLHR